MALTDSVDNELLLIFGLILCMIPLAALSRGLGAFIVSIVFILLLIGGLGVFHVYAQRLLEESTEEPEEQNIDPLCINTLVTIDTLRPQKLFRGPDRRY